MIIINEETMEFTTLTTCTNRKRYTSDVADEIKAIRRNVMKHSYSYGSVYNAEKEAERQIDKYIKDKSMVHDLMIGTMVIKTYEHQSDLISDINKILTSYENDEKVVRI